MAVDTQDRDDPAVAAAAERELSELEARGPRADPYRAGRSLTMARNGIVASSHSLASLAGLDMLRRGGSAMDAAVAAAATLGVVEPAMTGIGGDVFLLYYEAVSRRVFGLNGSGRAPAALSLENARVLGGESIPIESWQAVTVPGAVDAWHQGLERFGRLTFAEVLEPAIGYARSGFAVSERVHSMWQTYERNLRADRAARQHYLVDGSAPALGSLFLSPGLADSLEAIAGDGADAFYRGPIAREIVRYSEETGGFLGRTDFERHESTWVEPLAVDYRGCQVLQLPPNGQGLSVLLMLNLLSGFDLAALGHNTPQYLHLLVEAKKLAYADCRQWVADPDDRELPIAELLSADYAAERRRLIDPRRAQVGASSGLPGDGDTVYLTAIDQDGNCVSFINSIYEPFGSRKVGGDSGILLHNRGAGFSLEPGHPNQYSPGKRPFHTIIPGMVLRDGELYLSYGVTGAMMQPQGHVQFLLSHLDFGLNPQQAIDLPRWRHTSGLDVLLEHGTPRSTIEELRTLGHRARPADGSHFGSSHAILVDPATASYFGASDPRRDGAALGY